MHEEEENEMLQNKKMQIKVKISLFQSP